MRILILSGPTREYLDPVRYLSNASSGRQGIALAREALERGHHVDMVQGPVTLTPPSGLQLYPVVSAQEMLERAAERHPHCDVLIGAAAVSDYRPITASGRKHKRTKGSWTVELVPNPDILKQLGERKEGRTHVGFALETEDVVENARRKLESKNLDWIVCNSPDAIDAEEGAYALLGPDRSQRDLGRISKEQLARALLDVVERGFEK